MSRSDAALTKGERPAVEFDEREPARQSQAYRDAQEAIRRAERKPREVIREQEFVA